MTVLLQRLWIQLTSDRKRFVALCAMIVAGLLLWSRIILISNMPRTAVAEEGSGNGAQASSNMKGSITSGAGADNARPLSRIELWRSPGRDPFQISPQFFPRSNEAEALAQEQGKLFAQQAEESAVTAARLERLLQEQSEKYRLQAVMSGQAMAVISGRVYREGDELKPPPGLDEKMAAKFRLIEVRDKSAQIQTEVNGKIFSFELTLKDLAKS